MAAGAAVAVVMAVAAPMVQRIMDSPTVIRRRKITAKKRRKIAFPHEAGIQIHANPLMLIGAFNMRLSTSFD